MFLDLLSVVLLIQKPNRVYLGLFIISFNTEMTSLHYYNVKYVNKMHKRVSLKEQFLKSQYTKPKLQCMCYKIKYYYIEF